MLEQLQGIRWQLFRRGLRRGYGNWASWKIPYEIERNREIFYKGFKVGTHRLDFIVKGTLVVELKATTSITKSHIGQTYAYLRATGLKDGLIINFPYPEESEPNFKEILEWLDNTWKL